MTGKLLESAMFVLETVEFLDTDPNYNYLTSFIGAINRLELAFKEGEVSGREYFSINSVEGNHLLEFVDSLTPNLA